MKNRRIAIIGCFGGNETLLDGQTVKTKILYQELSDKTNWEIFKVDTYYKKKNPLKLLIQTFVALIAIRDIIIITSQQGRRFYFPLLYMATKLLGTRVYHSVIGARLAKYVLEYPALKKYLNSFQVNWVETATLQNDLESVGVLNTELMPNFKRLKIVSSVNKEISEPYKLCTFSRVMQEKGIEDAVKAVVAVNEKLGYTAYTLDIYGAVDEAQTTWFENLRGSFPAFVQYKGKVHYAESVATLKDYFALLFPTRFYTEGVPGTIIDAYAAGLPVIASRWESFSDVIEDGVTGVGYAFEDVNALINTLMGIANKRNEFVSLRINCVKRAEKFQPDEPVRRIIDTIMMQ